MHKKRGKTEFDIESRKFLTLIYRLCLITNFTVNKHPMFHSEHFAFFYVFDKGVAHDENPSLAGKNPDFILSALLDSWALILK